MVSRFARELFDATNELSSDDNWQEVVLPDGYELFERVEVVSDQVVHNYRDSPDFMSEFFQEHTTADPAEIAKMVAYLHLMMDDAELSWQTAVTLSIRVSVRQGTYDVPRWHLDGGPGDDPGFNFVAALKGKSTLFRRADADLKSKIFDEFWSSQKSARSMEGLDFRRKHDVMLRHIDVHHGCAGRGTVFSFGDIGTAALHSEPSLDTARIFVRIGTS